LNDIWIELVYDSLNGHLNEPLPQVENAFAPGSRCEGLYEQVLLAYERLCGRLGAGDEDEDVEIIVNALLEIQKRLCIEMYKYGARFANTGEKGA